MRVKTFDPSTGKVRSTFVTASPAKAEHALARAVSAGSAWAAMPLAKRAARIRKLAELIGKNRERIARMISSEMGKPITESRQEVKKCEQACRYFAGAASVALRPLTRAVPKEKTYIAYEPLGTILVITPWNYPLWQVIRSTMPTLLAGNTIIVKPSSAVPDTSLALQKLIDSILPAGVMQTIFLAPQESQKIIADDRIRGVALTGSTTTGRVVGRAAGSAIKPSTMELGGSDAFIVLDDADLQSCCVVAVQARMRNCGQSCTSAKRIIVTKKRAKMFIETFLREAKKVRIGSALDPKTKLGPLARQDLLAHLDRQVRVSVQKGARVLLGGKRVTGPGYFYEPTVLTDVKPGMPAYDQELFGPVACIFVVANETEAIKLANDTSFGLGASVWTTSAAKARRVASQLQVGVVAINQVVHSDPRLPFGGVKNSGYGRELGTEGFRAFVNVKTVRIR